VLSDALLYSHNYSKEIDDALSIVYALYRRSGRETTKFLCMRSRHDREQEMTCSLTEEFAAFLFDARQEEEKNSDDLASIVTFIKSNKKIYSALQKNCSAQYINRLLVDTELQAKGAKLKKFYKLTKHLF